VNLSLSRLTHLGQPTGVYLEVGCFVFIQTVVGLPPLKLDPEEVGSLFLL
jgi:hypothetical protein